MLLGAALMLFGYSQMDPATQKTARFTMLLAASGPASAVSALLQPIFESVERVQASAQTVTAVAILCLGSLLTLAGAVVMLLHLPRRTV